MSHAMSNERAQKWLDDELPRFASVITAEKLDKETLFDLINLYGERCYIEGIEHGLRVACKRGATHG